MFPYRYFEDEPEATTKWCKGIHHDERFANRRRGLDMFAGFCGIECREDYFSSVGGGDIRGCDPNSLKWEEIVYIKSLPSPA